MNAWRMKVYHRAKSIRGDGAVSALCFKRPRAINLAVASWVMRDDAVTCPKCQELMAQAAKDKA